MNQEESEDYKRGWYDGYHVGKLLPRSPSVAPSPVYSPVSKCSKCGMEVKGTMGYVCNDLQCPTFKRLTFTTGGSI
jgi:hypothetical protein